MVGGFLGAGKTTALLRFAKHLTSGGRRVGLITNDQSYGLVDTTMLSSHGFAVEEITGAVTAMRQKMLRVQAPADAIDVVGTGGDASGSFNISTCAALIVGARCFPPRWPMLPWKRSERASTIPSV